MQRTTLAVLVLMLTAALWGQPTALAATAAATGRLPAHAYLLGAHEIPGLGLIERNNTYQEFPFASIAWREFHGQDFSMTFSVLSHDTPQGASSWMWEVGRATQQKGNTCDSADLAKIGNPEEGWVCYSVTPFGAAVMFGARVKNRAAVVMLDGPATNALVGLAQSAVQFQVTRLWQLGP